jgi:hypothetical protein
MTLKSDSAIVVLIVSFAAAGTVAQDSQAVRTIAKHTDPIAVLQPQTLPDRIRQADAAIRGRVVRTEVRYQREELPPGVDPVYGIHPETQQAVEVLEIVKDHPRLAIPSLTVTVLQPVGTVIVDGVRVVKDADRMRGWLPGEEHLLFLHWDRGRAVFTVASEDDIFLLNNGVVATQGHSTAARAARNLPIPEFLTQVKAAAAAAAR